MTNPFLEEEENVPLSAVPEEGKLFDVPRIRLVRDDADPDALKLAFSGSVELDRANARQVDLYNRLVAGREAEIVVGVTVTGAKKVHRLDSEGVLLEVAEAKSVVVTDVFFFTDEAGNEGDA